MKFTTVIGVLLGLVLLSGDGVESQMTLNFDLPFVKLLLGGEDLIYNILIALRGFSNFRTNAMSSMGGGSGGGGGGSGGGELAASIRGLLDVLVKRGKSGSSNARKGFLDALRFINTVIASVVRTIMRLATNFVIGIGSQKLLDIAKQGRSKLQDQLNKLRPMNILKSLGNGPLRSMLGKIFDGSRLKAFLDFVFTIIKNRMQNNFNDMVNRIKANLRKLPSDLVNKIFEIGDKIKNRPKPLQNLGDQLANGLSSGREKAINRRKQLFRITMQILGGLLRFTTAAAMRFRDRLQTGIFRSATILLNALGRLGNTLSSSGPLRKLLGLGLSLIANRINMIGKSIQQIITGFQAVGNGLIGIVRSFITRIVNTINNYWFTNRIANSVVRRDRGLRALIAFITAPAKFISSLLPSAIKDGIMRRMDRRRKIADQLANMLSNLGKNLPRPLKNIGDRLGNLIKKRPLKNAIDIAVRIISQIGQVIGGLVRIFIQFVPIFRAAIARSPLLRMILGGGGGGSGSRPSLASRLASVINIVTTLVSRFAGGGGAAGAASNFFSGLRYAFGPLREIFS